MIARRLGALALAVAMIVGAYLVRTNVFEDDGGSTDDETPTPTVLVCIDELESVCSSLGGLDGITVVYESAADTLSRLQTPDAAAVVWLTLEPFPAMADELRSAARLDPLPNETTDLATSPLALVVRAGDAPTVVERCDAEAVALACLGTLGGLSPTFAPTSSAIGTLGVAAALVAFDGGALDVGSLELLKWAGPLKRDGARSLSGGTAINTIQTRATFAVAIGAEAELADARRGDFEVLYADPMIHLDAQLMVPSTASLPDGVREQLVERLIAQGWKPAEAGRPTGLPSPEVVLAARTYWEGL